MVLDFDTCYRALKSRDARFDGRFFVGVVTTRIYCRPICPAPAAKPRNIRFYPCAAAAQEAGLRPCRRCHPEASPGTPAWLGASATLSRGLRLITEGALNGSGVPGLALRLGLGDRQLRRLFAQHLGASPVAIASTQRLYFARKLIDETNLSMIQVAFQAGFGSVRQFNSAVRQAFGYPPRDLRGAARRPDSPVPSGDLLLRLPFRPPLDWAALIEFLRYRAIPGVESVQPDCYARTIQQDGAAGFFEVRPATGKSYLTLRLQFPSSHRLMSLVERVRRIFDLGADPLAIQDHLARDAQLKPLIDAYPGPRVPGAWDGFELAVRAILGQQVSVKSATTLAGRLVDRFGTPVSFHEVNDLTHLFPKAATLADADIAAIGLPQARAGAIRGLAAAVADGSLHLEAAAGLDEAVSRLTALSGVGEWTAQYIAMRALREPDAFPAGDLGLRRALSLYGKLLPTAAIVARAAAWKPWRAYAAMYLWKSLAAPEETSGKAHMN